MDVLASSSTSAVIDVFAVVGAVATSALVWSVHTWRHRRRTHLVVTTQNVMPALGGDLESCFGVTAVNRSDTP